MRYLIDSNIILFLVLDREQLTSEVKYILEDYGNRIYVSTESVSELLHLHQSGKVEVKRWKTAKDIIDFILNETNIEIKSIKEEHLRTLADLPLFADHKDPSDRKIIAQAITESIPIISSDRKFFHYEKHGLKFIFNKR